MQAFFSYKLLQQVAKVRPRCGQLRRTLLAIAMIVGLTELQLPGQTPRQPSQSQAAGQFLRAVLRADYLAAYGNLAPEVRQAISLKRFETAARPLWKSGQHRSPEIELYKLGVRLGDRGASRLFYSFSFAADSSLKPPPVLLEVTFRDTASRTILGFNLRTAAPVQRSVPVMKSPKKQTLMQPQTR
jgi:hypothetical protein